MTDEERKRILNMVSEGKLTVEEAEKLLDAIACNKEVQEESIMLKDTRGRKPKNFRIFVDAAGGENKKAAKVNISIPLSLVRAVGPIVKNYMPKEARTELDKNGIDVGQILSDLDKIIDEHAGEDIVNIDAGEGDNTAKVRIYVE